MTGLFGLVYSRLFEFVAELFVREVHNVVTGIVVHLIVNLVVLAAINDIH